MQMMAVYIYKKGEMMSELSLDHVSGEESEQMDGLAREIIERMECLGGLFDEFCRVDDVFRYLKCDASPESVKLSASLLDQMTSTFSAFTEGAIKDQEQRFELLRKWGYDHLAKRKEDPLTDDQARTFTNELKKFTPTDFLDLDSGVKLELYSELARLNESADHVSSLGAAAE